MTDSPRLREEIRFSREDVELLASIKGGQEALIQQVNSLQASVMSESEARRKQMDEQRERHEEQIRAHNTRLTEMEMWKVTTISADKVLRWESTAKDVEAFKERYKGIVWLWGAITAIISLGGGWVVLNVINPLFGGK